MPELSFRHLLGFLKGCAGPGLGGPNGTGDDACRDGGVEIVRAAGGGPLRLRKREKIVRHDQAAGDLGDPLDLVLAGDALFIRPLADGGRGDIAHQPGKGVGRNAV